ncbi:thymidylate kinase-domain-containing protein [Thelephora terrestris]|uniref:Thymidylate kinase n=1 Tax=Thelephora terrestris TaxID=56493 RepID=A0A9P6H4A5_9AGAM|nr:thymidylate kinase-domain-containing protein [Thelephora terrestris]
MTRGAFIVIEGLDRSGKSTQAARLLERIEAASKSVQLLKFPDRSTPIGQLIDSYLRSRSDMDDHTIHLLFSANRWEISSKIKSLLESGTTIICDRYAFSGIAFSASKALIEESSPPSSSPLTYEWCRAPDVSLPAPDLTLFLDISPEQAARQREGYGEERYEKLEMQARVREVFARIGKEIGAEGWVTIDAGRSREEVEKDIWEKVSPLVEGVNGPVNALWNDLL